MSRSEDDFDEAVQETITDFCANWDEDQQPTTREQLFDAIYVEAFKKWSTARRREARRKRLIEARCQLLEQEDLFQTVGDQKAARARAEELLDRLDVDPEGKLVLHAVLEKGIPFHKTKELALELGFSVRHTTNIKRRITRVAEKFIRERKGPRGEE